ncbi:MAG: SPFH domain-containing protein [Candidatus Dormibacteria bacterium]
MAFFARENIAVPDERKGQIVFKWPDQQIRRFTKAIVAPDEVAAFLYQGQVIGTLPPGRHEVDATELPFLGMFKDILTGNNAYRTELYFVSTREHPDQRFGGRIDDVQDPVTGLVVGLRVYGEYSLAVSDPVPLITRLTGTVDVQDNSQITDWVAEQLLKVLRTDVTAHITRNGWPILGLAAYVPEIEASVIQLAESQLETYGLRIARLGNFTISLSDEDEQTLKGLAKDTAYSRLAGSFGQYAAGEMQLGAGEGMSRGGGGATGGAFVAAGLGLGQQAAQPAQPGPTPPPPPGFAGGGAAGYQPNAATRCPSCGTGNPAGARFCATCGTALAPAVTHCTQCNSELLPGAKFCAACGHPVDAAAAEPAPPEDPPAPPTAG